MEWKKRGGEAKCPEIYLPPPSPPSRTSAADGHFIRKEGIGGRRINALGGKKRSVRPWQVNIEREEEL